MVKNLNELCNNRPRSPYRIMEYNSKLMAIVTLQNWFIFPNFIPVLKIPNWLKYLWVLCMDLTQKSCRTVNRVRNCQPIHYISMLIEIKVEPALVRIQPITFWIEWQLYCITCILFKMVILLIKVILVVVPLSWIPDYRIRYVYMLRDHWSHEHSSSSNIIILNRH